MTVLRVESEWVGGPSAPGLTVLHIRDGATAVDAALAAVRTFWDNLSDTFPPAYSVTVGQAADAFDENTGTLVGASSAAAPLALVNGSGTGVWAAGVGSRIDWHTDAISNGRRVRGRTFLVPNMLGSFDSDGTLTPGHITLVQGVANQLISDLDTAGYPLVVWQRPVNGAGGAIVDVNRCTVPDKPATLRGRRD